MTTPRMVVVGVIAAGALLLTSCGSAYRHYAGGLDSADLVGSWSTTNALGTQLVLEQDGTFRAQAWPTNLFCRGTQASRLDDLAADPQQSASGTWRLTPGSGDDVSGGTLPAVSLHFSDLCDDIPLAVPIRADDGSVNLCVPLDVDPDSFTSSRMFPFVRDPAVDEDSC